MDFKKLGVLILSSLLLTVFAQPSAKKIAEVDIIVYGGTSGGVIAAYTARQYGKNVLLVEPGKHLGGMSSGGLGATDLGDKDAVTGLSREFYRRVGKHYGQPEAWQFELHVAERVFNEFIEEAHVPVLFQRRVKEIRKEGTKIREIVLEPSDPSSGEAEITVRAKAFIDSSYEGDLMARAGVSYTVGREANSVYRENYNGVQMRGRHQFPDGVDPYVVPGDPSSGLLPEITGVGVEPPGTGDKKVQCYNFRMCLCQEPDNRLPFAKPARYDPNRYELLLRLMEKRPWKALNDGFIITPMPRGKTDWNSRGAFSTDYVGKNWDYPDAGYDRRAEIWREHIEYQQGLMFFLANDERVPRHIREWMNGWGVCKDEFQDAQGWPHQLYVREARRMIGEYVMTEHNCTGRDVVGDGIGMGAFQMDCHNVQRVVVHGMVKNEGNVEPQVEVPYPNDDVGGPLVERKPYPISYRSITPKREEVTNLLVTFSLSASHTAFSSIRMESVLMILSQAAAVAASMAVDGGLPVQRIDVTNLQRELRENPLAKSSRSKAPRT